MVLIAMLVSLATVSSPLTASTPVDTKTGMTFYGEGFLDGSSVVFKEELRSIQNIKTLEDVQKLKRQLEEMDNFQKAHPLKQ